MWKILRKHRCLVLIETKVKHQISPLKTFFQQAKSVAKTKDSEHWGHPLLLLFGKLMPGRKRSICIDAPFRSPKFHIPPEKTMVWICFFFLFRCLSFRASCYLFNILKCVCWTAWPELQRQHLLENHFLSFESCPSQQLLPRARPQPRPLFQLPGQPGSITSRPIAPMTTRLFNWRFWNTKLYITFNKSFWSWTFLQKKSSSKV